VYGGREIKDKEKLVHTMKRLHLEVIFESRNGKFSKKRCVSVDSLALSPKESGHMGWLFHLWHSGSCALDSIALSIRL